MNDTENEVVVAEEVLNTVSEEMLDVAQKNIDDIHVPTNDATIPDFDVAKIEEGIQKASYMELPIWKKRLTKDLESLKEVHEYLELYKQIKNTADLDALSKLDAVNELKSNGIDIDMELKSFEEKYEVNARYIEKMIAMVDHRILSEREEVEKSTTTVKTDMMIQMIQNNLSVLDDKHPNAAKLKTYFEAILKVYQNRDDIEWLWHIHDSGTNTKAVMLRYKKFLRNGNTVKDMLKKVFKLDAYISLDIPTKEQWEFFLYYLSYVSYDTLEKKLDIKKRIIKEQAMCCLQNLGDCENGLYDYGEDTRDRTPEEHIKYCSSVYLATVVSFIQTIWKEANK